MTVSPFEEMIAPIAQSLQPNEISLIRQAYELARSAHDGQKRMSGEAYFVHCVEVARILVDLHLDADAIAAALLHDTLEDTAVMRQQIEDGFGETVAHLVAGVSKMEAVKLQKGDDSQSSTAKQRREAEFLRKTLLAMDSDVRVILIKLADRLHNMRTLGYLSRERQIRMAQETMNIFAPLASRLGIWQMKWELEDLSFRYLDTERYKYIAGLIADRRADREKYIQELVAQLEKTLAEHDIKSVVSGRSKNIYSIWRKMDRKKVSFDDLYDIRAVRVIVDNVATCYHALGVIHQAWRPITGQFDDYIAAPKDNFYQSLHTAVHLPDGKTLEVQIRTYEMHVNAEYGIAAHWRYKELDVRRSGRETEFDRRIRHIRERMAIGKNFDDPEEYLETIQEEVLEDRIYVFTPRGDIVDLPEGSTPIDFAYHIHTDIGDRCRSAKVSGKLVTLDYQLQSGDRVEILTSRRGGPSRDWMNPNLGFVKTKRAMSKIRQWFRKQDRDKMIALGRNVLDHELKRLGVEKTSFEQIARLFDLEKVDDLLAQIGMGDIHTQHIIAKVLQIENGEGPAEDVIKVSTGPLTDNSSDGVTIQGVKGLLTNLARCCNPIQHDEIVGYITIGRGVTIHRKDCPNVMHLPRQRLIAVDWGADLEERYLVPVSINAFDREGLMRDIGAAVAHEHVNIREITVNVDRHMAVFCVAMEVGNAEQLNRVLSRLEAVPNVIDVRRKTN